MSDFPEPRIPALRPDDTIDLADVGSGHLRSFVKYPGMAIGDRIHVNWRGCSQGKQVFDALDLVVDVSEDNGYDEVVGMPVFIPNDLVVGVDQGWAFYSYIIERDTLLLPESLRQFAYVGVRPPPLVPLPVVQLREARGLLLDPAAMGTHGVTAVAPPYLAMQVGDRVTLHWRGYFGGIPDTEYDTFVTLAPAHIGKPLEWLIPAIYVYLTEGGEAHLHYSVRYAQGAQDSESDVQVFRVMSEPGALLPALRIDGHDGGGQLDPGAFPGGLRLYMEPYPGIRVGDQVLLHWLGNRESFSTVKSLRIDTSTLDSGTLVATVEPQWLEAAQGERISLFYQYARKGVAATAEALALTVRRPLVLPAPIVRDATAEGGSGENKGVLLAGDATYGAQVDVPESVPLGTRDRLEVHWHGHPAGGRHVATTPISENQRRSFFIPATAIAANMGSGESKRFEVFYRLTVEDELPQDSTAFHLRIEPLPKSVYPNVQCLEAQGNTSLSFAAVPITGATLWLDGWTFIAVGQLLTLEAAGVSLSGAAVSDTIRNALPVTASEFIRDRVDALLRRSFLQGLKRNQRFTLKARVSFDGGETFTVFDETSINLTD
ncbi:hypothetical protein [Pseudomonas sp. zfem002]|uniref:hypothetical protein n=1 Tax=Pseudomonas sp. zfem002 TaxID=3078197 RepID=UPI002927DD1C|nr:hypothetical protein [Pseudomonas sp. zfem002]MDU9389389.1 hypothetical protein [Pseudomonas sp. zfem002]